MITLGLLWSFEGEVSELLTIRQAPPFDTSAVIATGKYLFPFRTEKSSPLAPMVLGAQAPGRVGCRRFFSISKGRRKAALRRCAQGPTDDAPGGGPWSPAVRAILSGESARSRATRSATCRVRPEHARHALGVIERALPCRAAPSPARRGTRRTPPRGRGGGTRASARSWGVDVYPP